MKIPLAQLVAMLNTCTLCASAIISTNKDPSEIYQSVHKRLGDSTRNELINKSPSDSIASLMRDEKIWITQSETAHKNRRRNDIANNVIEMHGRRLPDGSGSGSGKGHGKGKGGTSNSNTLDICLNRHDKSVATARERSLNSESNYENESHSKGKSGGMGTRRKNRRCASKKRGKGGSSKSKYSKGQASDICSDYVFSTRRQLEHQKLETANNFKAILDVARGIPRLSIFVDLVERTNLASILGCAGPFTALLPANRAFRTLDPAIFADLLLRDKSGKLDDILLSHILPGRILSKEFDAGNLKALNGETVKVSINPLTFQQNVTTGAGDIIASNGVIHIIDSVLFTNVSQSVCDSGRFDFKGPSCGRDCTLNLIDLACEQPQLSTFLSLVQMAGLEEIFDCRGPFTLFAPRNDAFDDLRGHVWLELLKPENVNELKDLLLYHLVPGSFLLRELLVRPGGTPTLLLGENITISKNPLLVNSAQLVSNDVLACNGVLHIIDTVLDHSEPMPEPAPPPIHAPPMKTFPPTLVPSIQAVSLKPSFVPSRLSYVPSIFPSVPSQSPSGAPSANPSKTPISIPTFYPSETPTLHPSAIPIVQSEPPTVVPSVSPPANPSASPSEGVVRININRRIYFSYASESNVEPTASQYNAARRTTIDYYDDYIRRTLMVTRPLIEFIEWNATLFNTTHNAGIPQRRFNIYMEYDMVVAIYTKDSRNVPSPGEFLNLLKDGYVYEYLLNITSLSGTPFEMVTEGVFSTV